MKKLLCNEWIFLSELKFALSDWESEGAVPVSSRDKDWYVVLILIAFITGNSSLEPLIEGLCAQIHVNLRWRVFGRNRTGGLTDY